MPPVDQQDYTKKQNGNPLVFFFIIIFIIGLVLIGVYVKMQEYRVMETAIKSGHPGLAAGMVAADTLAGFAR